MIRHGFTLALAVCLVSAVARGEIVVNPARPITHRVTVQLIQTAPDSESPPATVFGNASQRAAIEAAIDQIWAQAGIDIFFLRDVVRYNNVFAYQGNSGSGARPTSDLATIRNNARQQGGILHPDSSVLNMFMVNVVPGFAPLSENSAAGLASIAANGIAAYTGDNLLSSVNGRDVVASVMAHEIGHNLGLDHTASGGANLMSPQGTTEQLTTSQIDEVFRDTSFPKAIPLTLVGDYNDDGSVDAADYTVWRNSLDQVGSSLAADGNDDGRVDSSDFTIWKSNFGKRAAAGTAAFGSQAFAVPEPTILVLVATATLLVGRVRRRGPRKGIV